MTIPPARHAAITGRAADTPIRQVNGAYRLQPDDNGKVLNSLSDDAVNWEIPTGLGVPFSCDVVQSGAGVVTFVSGGARIAGSNTTFVDLLTRITARAVDDFVAGRMS